jgi:hypothetical protein
MAGRHAGRIIGARLLHEGGPAVLTDNVTLTRSDLIKFAN